MAWGRARSRQGIEARAGRTICLDPVRRFGRRASCHAQGALGIGVDQIDRAMPGSVGHNGQVSA
jgi:hypothetical protein